MNQQKKRFKREKPNKKWTEEEVRKILNFLQDAPEVEAPTAQIFYKKLLKQTGIDATWELIRWKLRYLKTSFKKADDWRKSTGAGLLESDEGTPTVEAKLLQICPYYKELHQIFGEKGGDKHFAVTDTGAVVLDDDDDLITSMEFLINEDFEVISEAAPPHVEEKEIPQSAEECATIFSPNVPKQTQQKGNYFAEKLKKSSQKSSAAHLANFQVERTEMMRLKLEWEKEKHRIDHILEVRRIDIEEQKSKIDIEKAKAEMQRMDVELELRRREAHLKVLEMEKDERLKILEIEKDERIKKFEIEMKYKYQK